MSGLRMIVVALVVGVLSAAVFVVVFAATAVPVLAIVEDDHVFVTWGMLIGCAFVGWLAARATHDWLLRWARS